MATIVLEKVLFAAGVAALLVGAGVVGLRSGLPPVLHQGVLSFAGAAVLMVGATLVGVTRRTPWASSCLAFVRRFLPRWAFLEWGSQMLLEIEGDVRKALSGRRGAVANAAGFITLSIGLNALAPLIFFAFAYGQILSLQELVLFFALSTISSLFSWLTPGAIGIAEGAYAGIFGIMGLPIDGAVAFALVQRAASLPIVALGLLYLGRQGVTGFGKGKIEYGGAEPNSR